MSQLLLDGEVTPEVTPDPFAELKEQLRQGLSLTSKQFSDLAKRVERIEKFLASFNRSNGAPGAGSEPSTGNRDTAIWEEWKAKLNSKPLSAFIDAFLMHGELDANQLALITRCGKGNVSQYIYRLNKVNLINKNGNKFSLKSI